MFDQEQSVDRIILKKVYERPRYMRYTRDRCIWGIWETEVYEVYEGPRWGRTEIRPSLFSEGWPSVVRSRVGRTQTDWVGLNKKQWPSMHRTGGRSGNLHVTKYCRNCKCCPLSLLIEVLLLHNGDEKEDMKLWSKLKIFFQTLSNLLMFPVAREKL